MPSDAGASLHQTAATATAMKVGDLVEVHLPKGDIRLGKIASVGRCTLTVQIMDDPDVDAIRVPVWRLKTKDKDH